MGAITASQRQVLQTSGVIATIIGGITYIISVAYDGTNKWINPDGSIKWPPNNGAVAGTEKTITLKIGTILGRYGSDKGYYVTNPGADPTTLSLSPTTDLTHYTEYIVKRDIQGVISATIAPWFDQPGGGVQYLLPKMIKILVEKGYIRKT